jgi:repressor LexA
MIGAGIRDGDLVYISETPEVLDGEIAAVLIDDEATLKRVYYDREHNELALFAENPRFHTLRYVGESLNHIRILGRAVGLSRAI